MKVNRLLGSVILLTVLFSFFVAPVLGAGDSASDVWTTLYDLLRQPLDSIARIAGGNDASDQDLFYGKILIFLTVFSIAYLGLGVFAKKADWDEKKSKGAVIAISLSIGLMGAFAMPKDMVISLFTVYGAFVYIVFIIMLIGVFGFIYHKLGEGDRKRSAAEVLIFLILIYLLTNVLFDKLTVAFPNAGYLPMIISLINFLLIIGILWNIVHTGTNIFKKQSTIENKANLDYLQEKTLPAVKDWNDKRKTNKLGKAKKDVSSAKKDLKKALEEMEKLKKELDDLKKKPAPTPAEEKKKEDLAEQIEKRAEVAESIDKALVAEGEKPPESIKHEINDARKDAESTIASKSKLTPEESQLLYRLNRYHAMMSNLKEPAIDKYFHSKERDPKKLQEIGKRYHALYSILFEKMYDASGKPVGVTDVNYQIFARLAYSYRDVEYFLKMLLEKTPVEVDNYTKVQANTLKVRNAELSIAEAVNIISTKLNRKLN